MWHIIYEVYLFEDEMNKTFVISHIARKIERKVNAKDETRERKRIYNTSRARMMRVIKREAFEKRNLVADYK